MKDPIERQDAIDAIKAIPDGNWSSKRYVTAIKELPPAQPEIIRCRDCKHYYYADNRVPQEQRYSCDLDGDRWVPDSFCSFAERREDGVDR